MHVGAGLRHAEQSGLEIDHLVELLRAHLFSCAPDTKESGIESPERVLIGNPAAGVKLMLVSTGLPSSHRRQACAISEVGKDDRPCAVSSGQPGQLSHEE